MAICGTCNCPTDEPIVLPGGIFFNPVICPSCWQHETDSGVKRDIDPWAGHCVGDLYDVDGSRLCREQAEFELGMLTVGLVFC